MAGAMVGNPELSFSTIVSFITYDLPRIDGTQNGIANNCVSKHSKLHSQDALLIFSHYGSVFLIFHTFQTITLT
jgi:hypothetical protein